MNLPWYKEGLRFGCTGCGKCCTGAPGYVWVTEEEIVAMAEELSMPIEDFVRQYVRLVGDDLSLREIEVDGEYACVFLRGNKCSVYQNRPEQCRKFPWWPRHLESRQAWEEAAKSCEGMNAPDAPLFSSDEIEKLR